MWGNAASDLKPGERIEGVFFAQAVNPYWVLVTWLIVVIAHAFPGRCRHRPTDPVLPGRQLLKERHKRSAARGAAPDEDRPPEGPLASHQCLGEALWVPKQFH
jgi:hypothetical protein